MRVIYTLLAHLLLPVFIGRLFWRGFRVPAYRQRWQERLGRFEPSPEPGGLWVHAVSVGEAQAIAPLIRHLLESRPELPITVTTTTPTGSERVRQLFGDAVFHVYFPFDVPFALRGFLDKVHPSALLMVETEIWPNLLAICERCGIRSLLANARLSERSARRYRRFAGFTRHTLGRISRVAARTVEDARRFVELGVPQERVRVAGSIKFDIHIPAGLAEHAQVVRRSWGDRPAWVAASTHEGEDESILAAHARLLDRVPNALLVLVPRHPERFDRVFALASKRFPTVRRSSGQPCSVDTAVFLGDTMGELTLFLGAADAAFIGGSLVEVGGHNMLEASAQGVAVVFGPHVFNFTGVSELLLQRDAARQVRDADELAAVLMRWLSDASERSRIGENGRRVVAENRGALPALIEEANRILM